MIIHLLIRSWSGVQVWIPVREGWWAKWKMYQINTVSCPSKINSNTIELLDNRQTDVHELNTWLVHYSGHYCIGYHYFWSSFPPNSTQIFFKYRDKRRLLLIHFKVTIKIWATVGNVLFCMCKRDYKTIYFYIKLPRLVNCFSK